MSPATERLKETLDNPVLFNLVQFLVSGRQRRTRDLLRRGLRLKPDEPLLDVCCGTGEFAGVARGPYLGIDINPRYIAFARRRESAGGSRRKFVVGDITRFVSEYRGPSFPKAMMVNSMHHLSTEENNRVLAAVAHMIRPTGRFVVVDMDPAPGNIISLLLASMDRGAYIRPLDEQVALLSQYFTVERAGTYYSGLCGQTYVVCSRISA
jgi:ubiquinone/menaquinone biosynthesis C-methylase UbiE